MIGYTDPKTMSRRSLIGGIRFAHLAIKRFGLLAESTTYENIRVDALERQLRAYERLDELEQELRNR